MRELQHRQKVKRMMYSLPACLLLLVVTVLLVKGAIRVVSKQMESAERVSELEIKAAALLERESKLKENIRLLDTEEGVIKELKEKYSATQEREYVVVIVDEDERRLSSTTPQKSQWFKRFIRMFTNMIE